MTSLPTPLAARHGDDDPTPQGGPSPWRSPRFLAAAAVVAVLVVLAGVLVLRGGDGQTTTAPPQPATGSQGDPQPVDEPQQQPDGAAESVCGLEPRDQTVPVPVAPPTTWQLVGGLATPTDPDTYGPGQASDIGVRSCYSRDPVGALYAAANFVALSSSLDLEGLEELPSLAAPGPGRQALTAVIDDLQGPVARDSAGSFAVNGYQYVTYDSDVAVFNLAYASSAGTGFSSLPITMTWLEGDWRIALPASGNIGEAFEPLPSLAGFVPWSAS